MRADKGKVGRLLRTARGQIDGVIKMIEEDRYCVDISNQIMAASSVLARANREVLQAHIAGCVADAFEGGDSEQKLSEVLEMLDKLIK